MATMQAVVGHWMRVIELAWETKMKQFADDAEEAMKFFNGPYDWLYNGTNRKIGFTDSEFPAPSFQMTVNKVAEMTQLFGPALYTRNPVRKVNPRKTPEIPVETLAMLMGIQPDPMGMQVMQMIQQQQKQEHATDEARAILLEHYLNYTPTALNLKDHAREAIDEALIKGLGLLWTEVYQPPGSGSPMIGSFYDSVDNLVIDPDAESMETAKWVARRCVHPYWEVERLYNLPPDTLKGKTGLESTSRSAAVHALNADYRRRQGQTNDLLVYWKIYSKMGLGGRIAGMDSLYQQPLNAYPDYCYLVICENHEFPLNVPHQLAPMVMESDPNIQQQVAPQVAQAVQWPTPFWANGEWPFTRLFFHSVPRQVWPMSHLKPALGELTFLNWAYCFLASKVRIASRDFIAVAKSAAEEVKEKLRHAGDYTLFEIEQLHESVDKVVQFLQHPTFNGEIYNVIEGVTQNFERRTGLSELLYGMTARQIRSAQEAQIRGDYASIRPDDMAAKVEDSMTELARKEALAARWHLNGQQVRTVLGNVGGQVWDMLLTPSDPAQILFQLEYRIEAGSAKKPNKGLERENLQAAMQNVLPILVQYAQATGVIDPVNALLSAWAKSIDLNASSFLLPPPPPPQPMPPPGQEQPQEVPPDAAQQGPPPMPPPQQGPPPPPGGIQPGMMPPMPSPMGM